MLLASHTFVIHQNETSHRHIVWPCMSSILLKLFSLDIKLKRQIMFNGVFSSCFQAELKIFAMTTDNKDVYEKDIHTWLGISPILLILFLSISIFFLLFFKHKTKTLLFSESFVHLLKSDRRTYLFPIADIVQMEQFHFFSVDSIANCKGVCFFSNY